jgi:hypothetical protein
MKPAEIKGIFMVARRSQANTFLYVCVCVRARGWKLPGYAYYAWLRVERRWFLQPVARRSQATQIEGENVSFR